MVHSHAVHLPLGALLSPCTVCGTGKDAGLGKLAAQALTTRLLVPGNGVRAKTFEVLVSKVGPALGGPSKAGAALSRVAVRDRATFL